MTVQKVNLSPEEMFQKQWQSYQTVRAHSHARVYVRRDMH